MEVRIINVYGPHSDQNSFWESLLGKYLLKVDNLIIGGDFNFSLGEAESWGPSAHPDNQATFFNNLLSSKGLIDIAPLKLLPTWRNMRVGEARVAKRLDRFLISETLVMLPFQFHQWIGSGGESDHSPVWFEFEGGPQNPASPFKFNSSWLMDEGFQKLVKSNWIGIRDFEGIPTAIQFATNLRRIKKLAIPWENSKQKEDEQELQSIEEQLELIYQDSDSGFTSDSSRDNLKRLEARHRQLLADQEATWRLKSRAIWLENGDENTKFFQAYAKGRKEANTIWSLKDQEGRSVTSFEGLANMGKIHFQSLFKVDRRVNITDIIRLALYFPSFVDEEGNRELYAEVTEAELKETLHSFQKDKSPGPDGWTIEFYRVFLTLLEETY
jgi:hypothetical protein